MNQQTVLPWGEKEERGILKASIQTVFRGLLFPSRTLYVTESTPAGRAFFIWAFGIWCCVPMSALSLITIVAERVRPEAFRFQDINPFTTLIAIPLQMVVGPLVIWLLGWCMLAGLRIVSATAQESRETVRNLGWYLGTIVLFVIYTWLGVMVPLYSVRAWARHVDPKEIVVDITILVGLILLLRTALVAIKTSFKTTWLKSVLGLVVTLTLFSLAGLPVVILLNIILALAMR